MFKMHRIKPVRQNAGKRGYDATHRKRRIIVLAEEPVCRICRSRPATELDHIIPLRKGGTNHRENLQGLCGPCHRFKTRQENT